MKHHSRKMAYHALDQSIKIWSERLASAEPSHFLNPKLQCQDAKTLGSFADLDARREAGRALIDEIVAHYKRTKNQNLRHYLATFCWEAGDIDPEHPFDYDLKAMEMRVYKQLRSLRLSAICVPEAVALRRSQHNEERLMLHVHAVCWTSAKNFQPMKAAQQLHTRSSMRNSFGAPCVSFQSRKMAAASFQKKDSAQYKHLFSKLDRDQSKSSMAWLGYYLFQAPAWVKQLTLRPGKNGGLSLRSNKQNYAPSLALALNRLLSSIDIADAVFSVGDGKSIRTPWARRYRKAMERPERMEKRRCQKRKARKKAQQPKT